MGDTANLLRRLRNGSAIIALLAFAGVAASFATDIGPSRPILMGIVASMLAILVAIHAIAIVIRLVSQHRMRIIINFLEHDTTPGFCTDDEGRIFAQNRAATDRFGDRIGATMTRALNTLFANPEAVVHRLQIAVQGQATTREDVVTRKGHVRVAIHGIPGGHLWRLEDIVDKPSRAADGIGLPILTFGSSGTILSMNDALRQVVGKRVKRLRDLFEEVPLENGAVNRMKVKSGSEPVRLVLSEPVNNRQEAYILPAGEATDGRIGLDVLPVALLRLDAEGMVVFANRAARELLPATAGTGEARLAAMVEGLGRSVREWTAEAAAGRGLCRPEVVRVTNAAEETFLQITLSRPLDGDGGLIAVLNDATELKTMEAQFVQSQKMQAIGQLAGGVAHDFNNLLTAISGHCDLLLLRRDEADEDYADLIQITQNANRAAALVGQLLAFSRKQTLEMQQVDLRDTLGDLTHLLNRLVGERTELRLDHDPALIPIRGDRRQLEQVLMNLVVNARDAMPEGGKILVETRCRYLERPMTRDRATVPAGQYVVVSVTDQGCGIPRDSLSRIFEPFFTTKRPGEGTGLGLSMVYGIVKQSGGFIFCDSTVGEGTCFSLFFPADLEAVEGTRRDGTDAILAPALSAITSTGSDIAATAPLRIADPESHPQAHPVDASAAQAAADPFADLPEPDPIADSVEAAPAVETELPPGADEASAPPKDSDDIAPVIPPEKTVVPSSEPADMETFLASVSRAAWDIPEAPLLEEDASLAAGPPTADPGDPVEGPDRSPRDQTDAAAPAGAEAGPPSDPSVSSAPEDPLGCDDSGRLHAHDDDPVPSSGILADDEDAAPEEAVRNLLDWGDVPSESDEVAEQFEKFGDDLRGDEPSVPDGVKAVERGSGSEDFAPGQSFLSNQSGIEADGSAQSEVAKGPEASRATRTAQISSAPDAKPSVPLPDDGAVTPGGPADSSPAEDPATPMAPMSDIEEHVIGGTADPDTAAPPPDDSAEQAAAAREVDGERTAGMPEADGRPDAGTPSDLPRGGDRPSIAGQAHAPHVDAPSDPSARPVETVAPPATPPTSPAETLIRDAERVAEESTRKPIVLLVEDEAPVRAFASRALRLRGCTVLEAANAEDALETLMDAELKVDLFVTDVMMPGMDGPSWVREALKDRPDVRTVFMSGYTQDALSDTNAPVPNAVFLPKPFSLSDLTRTVERALA